jgi:Peptidase A4 family/Protein of unknown function (DUF3761)
LHDFVEHGQIGRPSDECRRNQIVALSFGGITMETTFPSGVIVRSYSSVKGVDFLKAINRELVGHGLPPRPNDPTLLSHWENLMKGLDRSGFVEPKFRRTDRRHGPAIRSGTETEPHWSGGVVFLPPNSPAGAKFYVVAGQWTVPNPMPGGADEQLYYCSSWIGIDGDNSADVLQAGVECEARFTGSGTAKRIYPWWEWYPENEIEITNLDVSVGNLLVCLISSQNNTTANIVLSNSTNSQWTAFEATAPTGTTLVGNCAEWIVERPSVGGVFTQLANYGSVTFQEAFGGTNLPGSDAVRDPSVGDAINMIGDDGTVVSTATVEQRQVNCLFSGTGGPPPGATALCRDGTYSFSQHHDGTCSYHGGVESWV